MYQALDSFLAHDRSRHTRHANDLQRFLEALDEIVNIQILMRIVWVGVH